MLIDSGFKVGENCYHQVFLEKYKNDVKGKKMPKYITDDVEMSSDESSGEDSNEKDSDEENFGGTI